MPDFPQITPTPAQMKALSASYLIHCHLGRAAKVEQRRPPGPSIGRKRRARRARGRGRNDG
jgi:hypothetical protein